MPSNVIAQLSHQITLLDVWQAENSLITGQDMSFVRDIVARLREFEQSWQWHPMETAPRDRPFIICWNHSPVGEPHGDVIGWEEYQEVLEFGEPPARGWWPFHELLPAHPVNGTT